MKKIFLLIGLTFLLSVSLYSQVLRYDTHINYKNSGAEITADITITISDGKPGFNYILMTNDVMKGDVLMQSGPVKKNTYTFRNVKPGKYLLKIIDGNGTQTGRTIIIEETEN